MPPKPDPIKYPLVKRAKYPHMRPEDVKIWERFLEIQDYENVYVAYDVHLGSIPTLPPDAPVYLRKHVQAVYPKKADLVMYFPTQTLVTEVKPFAGLSAIGQALGYRHLFAEDFPFVPEPVPCIITDFAQPDIAAICRKLRITLVELSPETPKP